MNNKVDPLPSLPERDVRIVLVNPSHPGNIGAAARAMKTMALSQLWLVAPEEYPDPRAVWRAAGARDVLESAQVVATLDQALAECDWVIGTSARGRRIPWPLVDARQCAEQVYQQPAHSKIAILFGREDSGLSNEELQRCNSHVHIPTNEQYGSLNLAMAVQILSYELRMRSLAMAGTGAGESIEGAEGASQWDEPFATAEDIERFHEHLAQTLAELDFYDPDNPRQLLTRLRRLFARVRLDRMELNILRGILGAVQEVIKKR